MIYDKETVNYIHSLDSRKVVGYSIAKLFEDDDRIVAVYADVGSRFEIAGKIGQNGVEIGIAEQSLIPLLGGMAHEGFIPYGIAYAPFITMRAADQIRMTAGEMNLNIKMIGGSAGLVSGNLGAASLALDDIAMMRAIPNMIILSPADCLEAAKCIEAAARVSAPVYIRLTGNKMPVVYHEDFDFQIGKAVVLCEYGEDAILYANGFPVHLVMQAAQELRKSGIYTTVVNMTSIKPIDKDILDKFSGVKTIFSIEEHNVIGGLGSAIAEYVAGQHIQRVIRLGVNDTYMYPDTYDHLLAETGLSVAKLVEKISMCLR